MISIDGFLAESFRFADDRWDSQEFSVSTTGIFSYDKFQHFFGSLIGTILLSILLLLLCNSGHEMILYSALTMLTLGFLWEIKDGFIPDKDPNYIRIGKWVYCFGGDGFSWKDLLADWIGIQIGMFITSFLFQVFRLWN